MRIEYKTKIRIIILNVYDEKKLQVPTALRVVSIPNVNLNSECIETAMIFTEICFFIFLGNPGLEKTIL